MAGAAKPKVRTNRVFKSLHGPVGVASLNPVKTFRLLSGKGTDRRLVHSALSPEFTTRHPALEQPNTEI